jgi:hypothetical protein
MMQCSQVLYEHKRIELKKLPRSRLFNVASDRELMAFPNTPSIVEHANVLEPDLFKLQGQVPA